jgi:NTE family protein
MLYNKALNYMDGIRTNLKKQGMTEDKINQIMNVPGNNFTNKRSVNLHIIRPEGYLGGGPGGLTFDPNEMKGMVTKGETSMNQYIARLTPGSSVLV